MPGYLLHQGATILCMHAGQAMPVMSDPRVKVNGLVVVTQPTMYTVSGCALSGTSNPPCVTAQWITAASRVKASSQPVLLQDSQALCTPSGGSLTIAMTQMRVRGT